MSQRILNSLQVKIKRSEKHLLELSLNMKSAKKDRNEGLLRAFNQIYVKEQKLFNKYHKQLSFLKTNKNGKTTSLYR